MIKMVLMFVALLYGLFALGLALTPAVAFFHINVAEIPAPVAWIDYLYLGMMGVLSFVIFGISLMVLAIIFTRILPKVKAGAYPINSFTSYRWFFNGILPYLVSILILDFLILTGLNTMYFRLMGATIGKGVHINTKDVSDFHLLTIGDGAVIGGQSTIIGHVAEADNLTLKPVTVGRRSTIGLGAVIFPGVVIGDHAIVGAKALVPKEMKIPANEIYSGIPAKRIASRQRQNHL